MLRLFPSLLLGLLLLLLAGGCQQESEVKTIKFSGSTMGTSWSVTIYSTFALKAPPILKQKLEQRLVQINRLMSTYDPTSEISRFNDHTGTDCFAVSAATAQVVELSREISSLSSGAFDISVGPLVELWGFGARKRSATLPSDEQINERLSRTGYENIQLCRAQTAIRKRIPELRIDLSAVAKGYAVDELAGILRREGLDNYIVDIGGEIKVSGQRGDGTPWRVAIEKPLEDVREIETIFSLRETALATSGNYRNYYVADGQRYSHTLDPASGRPVRHKLASVSVLDSSCARADALATALMVMGEVKGRQFCVQNRIAAFFLIHEKDTIVEYRSPAFKKFFETVKE